MIGVKFRGEGEEQKEKMEQKGQKAPQRVEAQNTNAERPATFIFLHGFGDDADGFISEISWLHSPPSVSFLNPQLPHIISSSAVNSYRK